MKAVTGMLRNSAASHCVISHKDPIPGFSSRCRTESPVCIAERARVNARSAPSREGRGRCHSAGRRVAPPIHSSGLTMLVTFRPVTRGEQATDLRRRLSSSEESATRSDALCASGPIASLRHVLQLSGTAFSVWTGLRWNDRWQEWQDIRPAGRQGVGIVPAGSGGPCCAQWVG